MISGGGLQDLGNNIRKFAGSAKFVLGIHLFKRVSAFFMSDRFLGERSCCLLQLLTWPVVCETEPARLTFPNVCENEQAGIYLRILPST